MKTAIRIFALFVAVRRTCFRILFRAAIACPSAPHVGHCKRSWPAWRSSGAFAVYCKRHLRRFFPVEPVEPSARCKEHCIARKCQQRVTL